MANIDYQDPVFEELFPSDSYKRVRPFVLVISALTALSIVFCLGVELGIGVFFGWFQFVTLAIAVGAFLFYFSPAKE